MLSLGLGVACNNRCGFCYQQDERRAAGPKLLDFDAAVAVITAAARGGETELSLLGGEPTIHPRFLDIVRAASAAGMRTVAITTNGRALADPARFAAAVAAGLTSIGVSIHGPDAATHDALCGVPGAFAAAIATVEHAAAAGLPVSTFTLINRQNLDRLAATAARLHAAGSRLVLFQPFVTNRHNVRRHAEFAVSLAEIEAPLLAALRQGYSVGYQAKIYNLPVCAYLGVLPVLDLSSHAAPGAFGGVRETHVALAACAGCALAQSCGGVTVPLIPSPELAAHLREAVDVTRAGGLWLSQTDLLAAADLAALVAHARRARPVVRATFGGTHVAGAEAVVAAAGAGAEVVLVHRDPVDDNQAALAPLLPAALAAGRAAGVIVSASAAGAAYLRGPAAPLLGAGGRAYVRAAEGAAGDAAVALVAALAAAGTRAALVREGGLTGAEGAEVLAEVGTPLNRTSPLGWSQTLVERPAAGPPLAPRIPSRAIAPATIAEALAAAAALHAAWRRATAGPRRG